MERNESRKMWKNKDFVIVCVYEDVCRKESGRGERKRGKEKEGGGGRRACVVVNVVCIQTSKR